MAASRSVIRSLAVPREQSGVPMEATRAPIRRQIIRHNVKRLHLLVLPASTLQPDLRRERVAPELAEVYPQFAQKVLGVAA